MLNRIKLILLKRVIKRNKGTSVFTNTIPLKVIKNIGRECTIGKEVKIYKDGVTIGDYTYINGGKIFYGKIGKFCSIGYGVYIGSGEHYTSKVSAYPLKNKIMGESGLVDFPEQKYSLIGNDVWIGNNVCVKQGVKIGDGAIIASGAVVTKDVSPYTIVGGVPAKIIRNRFDLNTINRLSRIQWWNWSTELIKSSISNGEFDDVGLFLKNNVI